MNKDFVKTDGYFRSSSDTCDIYYSVYTPQSAPSAIVQIVHDICESTETYGKIISFLVSKGYVVCIHDQLGHGKSAETNGGEVGFFAETDGDKFLIEDVEKLRELMRKKYRRLPYFLLGHGFGAFISQTYASAYTQDTLDGLIIASPCKENLGLLKFTTKLSIALRGAPYRRTSNDLSAKAYCDILTLASYAKGHTVPRCLPVLIVGGISDRLGRNGKSAVKLYEKYFSADVSDVSMKIYENNLVSSNFESDLFSDISEWIIKVVDAKIELIKQNTFHF